MKNASCEGCAAKTCRKFRLACTPLLTSLEWDLPLGDFENRFRKQKRCDATITDEPSRQKRGARRSDERTDPAGFGRRPRARAGRRNRSGTHAGDPKARSGGAL